MNRASQATEIVVDGRIAKLHNHFMDDAVAGDGDSRARHGAAVDGNGRHTAAPAVAEASERASVRMALTSVADARLATHRTTRNQQRSLQHGVSVRERRAGSPSPLAHW